MEWESVFESLHLCVWTLEKPRCFLTPPVHHCVIGCPCPHTRTIPVTPCGVHFLCKGHGNSYDSFSSSLPPCLPTVPLSPSSPSPYPPSPASSPQPILFLTLFLNPSPISLFLYHSFTPPLLFSVSFFHFNSLFLSPSCSYLFPASLCPSVPNLP